MMKKLLPFLFLITSMMMAKPETIRYTLGMSKPTTHLFEVQATLEHLSKSDASLDFILPVWRPGRYVVLDFASGIQEFSAVDGSGSSLKWTKTNKYTWHVESHGSETVTIRYKVYANEFWARTRGLNDEHGFVDGTSVFMYVEKYRRLPVVLTVHPFGNWHVTTGLDSSIEKQNEFHAPDYDVFVDCPLEIGTQKDFPFDVDGTPHVLSIQGEGNYTADTLIRDMTKIIRVTRDLWGSFPYKRYIFMFECSPQGSGGTEHLNSAVMGVRPYSFKGSDSYKGILGLISHEYFHTWNVKQLRPKGLNPYDYTKENYSDELWIAEGTTTYYGDLILARAGFITPQMYLDDIAGTVQGDRQRPGNNIQSLKESSFDAWVKYWHGNQQSYNSESDYYGKGAIVSALLDLEIRQRSANKASLDDVLRTMFKRFPLSGTGYTIHDFQHVAEEFAGSSLNEFFTTYVNGTAPIPWEQFLKYAGLELTLKDTVAKPWMGIGTSDNNGRVSVASVTAGSSAYMAGLDIGDELIAMNGNRIRSADFSDRIKECAIGDTVTITLLRNDKLKTISVVLQAAPLLNYKITKTQSPSELQKSMYQSWLSTTWDETKK